MRDEFSRFRDAKVRPFGVNPAGSESHAAYAEQMGFPFLLLSDPRREISRQYHALKADGRAIERTVYLISRNGRVRFASRGAPGVDIILEGIQD